MQSTPYEYYNGKLGVKMSYLISDRNFHPESLKLISYNALYKRVNSKTQTEDQLRRACLNLDGLVLFSSLSQQWRDSLTVKFGSPQEGVKKSWFAQHYESDRNAFDYYNAHTYGDDNRKLDTALIEKYTYNASVLNTVLKIRDNRKAYAKALGVTKLDLWESLSKDVNAFRDVAHDLPTSSRGLRMKVNAYVANSYAGIISGRLQNQNASKVKDNVQQALLDELLAKHTNLDNEQVTRLYNAVAGQLEWKPITAQTVANIKVERNLIIYAGRNGKNALLDNKLMQNKRSAPGKPMLMWTLDGWDAELLYQKTSVNKSGHSVTTYHNRMTMVVVLDPFTKYPIGYAIGSHETPDLIKSALRNAVQHTKELFGDFYRPFQLQSDNYAKGTLKPTYEACSKHYVPARVKNAKSKIIEPWFNRFNKDYLQMFNNWSGHNIDSGSLNQPNDEMLNKLRHTFPDENGCREQLIAAIEGDRAKKVDAYVKTWGDVPAEQRSIMTTEMYLQYLGETTGYTNRLQPEGLTPRLLGMERCYDSFDINFRRLAHLDWAVFYDPNDLSQVLVANAESKKGKIDKVIGTYRFMLQEKYIQPMALAERNEGDALALSEVKAYNNMVIEEITGVRAQNALIIDELFRRPELENTLAKLVLVDSNGQHKNQKNTLREATVKQIAATEVEITKENESSWQQQQSQYHKEKVNINDYL